MRIFLDASILFSAAKSAGAVRQLLARVQAAGHNLCADVYVVSEAYRNLAAKAEGGLPALDAMVARIEVGRFHATDALPRDVAAMLPEKDQPVWAAAARLRCELLVTGDRRHFGPMYGRHLHGVTVHSPLTLAQALGLAREV